MSDKTSTHPTVAAFDFDGTLSYSDTLIFFLLYCVGPTRTVVYLLLQLPALIAFVLGKSTRQQIKERILKKFFGGIPIEEVRNKGMAFAQEKLFRHIRPKGLQRLQWHRNQGHRCVLVSASLDVYLQPWAQSVGFDDILSSRLKVSNDGKVTGKLEGLNCRRAEKVRRLTELLGPREHYRLYAYGDSHGDKELLETADYSFYREMPIGE